MLFPDPVKVGDRAREHDGFRTEQSEFGAAEHRRVDVGGADIVGEGRVARSNCMREPGTVEHDVRTVAMCTCDEFGTLRDGHDRPELGDVCERDEYGPARGNVTGMAAEHELERSDSEFPVGRGNGHELGRGEERRPVSFVASKVRMFGRDEQAGRLTEQCTRGSRRWRRSRKTRSEPDRRSRSCRRGALRPRRSTSQCRTTEHVRRWRRQLPQSPRDARPQQYPT